MGNMAEKRLLDELRKKAHSINCELVEEDYNPRDIEIIGYYLKRIATSYLRFQIHQELAKAEGENKDETPEKHYELYGEY
jgi:hypothetical protein